jgi:hypothetical protein
MIDGVRRLLSLRYQAHYDQISRNVVVTIIILIAVSFVSSIIMGITTARWIEKPFDHLRQFCLTKSVALIAVITAGLIFRQQQIVQRQSQEVEKLQTVGAWLTYKTDEILNGGISRIYATQTDLGRLSSKPRDAKLTDFDALGEFAALL